MALGPWTGDTQNIKRSWVAVLLREASRVWGRGVDWSPDPKCSSNTLCGEVPICKISNPLCPQMWSSSRPGHREFATGV